MQLKIHKYGIILILLLAFIVRFINLGSYPSLNPDEAAIGYNAYSLLLTGKDEHGVSWPIHFKSFGDFKPGGYFYLVLPFVKIFGLSSLSVRLPNLILSLLTIFFVYKLINLLTGNISLSLISSLLLTISPWHIHFSRGGWESSAALSFVVMGIYFFFLSLKNKFFLNFSLFVLFFVISLYIYHSARLVAPLLAFSLFIINYKYFLKNYKKIILPVIFGILICLPVAVSFLHSGGSARFGGVGLTADQGPVWRANELLNQHGNTKIINRLIHNKRLLYLISWGQKYSSHFDLNFLFINGDEVPRSKVPEMGQMYLLELPFFLFGVIYLLKSKVYTLKFKSFIFSFLFIAPIASSLTFQAPSALRSLPMVIPLTILTSVGLYSFICLLPKIYRPLTYTFITVIYIFFFAYYLDAYFIHYEKHYPFAWNYGFDQLIPYVNSQKNNYKNIFITDTYDQPYIIYLFYSKYPPRQIQPQIKLTPPDQYGFSTVRQIDNIHFDKINPSTIPAGSLIVADAKEINSTPIKVINFPNGQPAFKIYIK